MKIAALGLLVALALTACSSPDAPPENAVEGQLRVVMKMGPLEPGRDRRRSVTLKVDIEDEIYRLEFGNGTRLIGFSGLAAPELGGRDVLVSGDRDGDILRADYLKVVDGDDGDIVVVGDVAQ